jgi:hypothetical protein
VLSLRLSWFLTFWIIDRTGELRKLGFAGRRLGPVQMTTDTAVNVTKRVVEDRSKYTNTCSLGERERDSNLF